MLLRRWEPFGDLRRMHCNAGRFFPHSYPHQAQAGAPQRWAIPLDVVEEEDQVFVHASIPGMAPEDIEVSLENHVLTIKGQSQEEREHQEGDYLMRECRSGSFQRQVRLPNTLDFDNAASSCRNGVLTVTLPKAEAKKVKKLTITSGEAANG